MKTPLAVFIALMMLAAPLYGQEFVEGDVDAAALPANVALLEKAYVAHRKGDFAAAAEGYSKVIRQRGLSRRERGICYLLRGEAKRDNKDLDGAVADFTRALRQWPGYPQAHFFRGRVYEAQGKLLPAYYDVYHAAQLEPGREAYDTALALLRQRLAEANIDVPLDGAVPEPVSPKLAEEGQ